MGVGGELFWIFTANRIFILLVNLEYPETSEWCILFPDFFFPSLKAILASKYKLSYFVASNNLIFQEKCLLCYTLHDLILCKVFWFFYIYLQFSSFSVALTWWTCVFLVFASYCCYSFWLSSNLFSYDKLTVKQLHIWNKNALNHVQFLLRLINILIIIISFSITIS